MNVKSKVFRYLVVFVLLVLVLFLLHRRGAKKGQQLKVVDGLKVADIPLAKVGSSGVIDTVRGVGTTTLGAIKKKAKARIEQEILEGKRDANGRELDESGYPMY